MHGQKNIKLFDNGIWYHGDHAHLEFGAVRRFVRCNFILFVLRPSHCVKYNNKINKLPKRNSFCVFYTTGLKMTL